MSFDVKILFAIYLLFENIRTSEITISGGRPERHLCVENVLRLSLDLINDDILWACRNPSIVIIAKCSERS